MTECPYLLACFDTTRRATLDSALARYKSYKQSLTPHTPPQLALLVGLKSDRRADADVSGEEVEERAAAEGMGGYVECSAATGDGVEELFERVARHVAEQAEKKRGVAAKAAATNVARDEESESPREDVDAGERVQQSRQMSADDSDED